MDVYATVVSAKRSSTQRSMPVFAATFSGESTRFGSTRGSARRSSTHRGLLQSGDCPQTARVARRRVDVEGVLLHHGPERDVPGRRRLLRCATAIASRVLLFFHRHRLFPAARCPHRVFLLRRRRNCPAAVCYSALRRCRRLPGRSNALALHLVGLPVGVLVLLRAVPLRFARCAVARRLLPARRQPAQQREASTRSYLNQFPKLSIRSVFALRPILPRAP